MSKQDRNQHPQRADPLRNLTEQDVRQVIRNQAQEAANDAAQVKLQSQELEYNYKLAQRSLELRGQENQTRGTELRKTTGMYAAIGLVATIAIGVFIFKLLENGYQDFLEKAMWALSYVVVSGLSYYFGKGASRKSQDENGDVEIIQ